MERTAKQRQLEMLRLYGDLISQRESWGGRMVLAFGRNAHLVPVPVSIAGGATLLVDEDGAAMKATLRRSELDFVVNTLDEALRALKNEIRKKRPLGVGLVSSVPGALAEMVERGVAPDLTSSGEQGSHHEPLEQSFAQLRRYGLPWRHLPSDDVEHQVPILVELRGRHCSAWHVAPKTIAELRAADAVLLASLPADDEPRRRWLQLLPKYMRDSVEGGRWLWLDKDEASVLSASLPISPESRP